MVLRTVLFLIQGVLIFLIGFLCAYLVVFATTGKIAYPFSPYANSEGASPQDWVKEENIRVYDDRVEIYVNNPGISRYAWSGSMKPALDGASNGIRIVPDSPEKIKVGDIVTFKQGNIFIVHRVVDKGVDEEGIYFITKGDNNEFDDGKIRFGDIKYVVIALVY